MKKIYFILFMLLTSVYQINAQVIDSCYLNINNIKALFNSNGINFWDFNSQSNFYVPANSTKTSMFSQSLWIGGKNSSGDLFMAADRYGGNGFDFSTGPISFVYDSIYDANWGRIFKITRASIDSFIVWHNNNSLYPGYQVPNNIKFWPAHGDVSKGQAFLMAPFKDVNQDGSYDFQAGDYPLIKGDMALWYVYNDERFNHGESGGNKLHAEVHVMAYAYNCPGPFNNTIFMEYKIFKRNLVTMPETWLGIFSDFDVGYANDDYTECDVSRAAFYAYNGDSVDNVYGIYPPAIGISVLKGPYMDPDGVDNPLVVQDSSGNPVSNCDWAAVNGSNCADGIIDNERYGLTGFISFNNYSPFGYLTDPETAPEYYNYFNKKWKNGTDIFYGANGDTASGAYGPQCAFMYPGLSDSCNIGLGGQTPNGPKNWTEISANHYPGDRRGVGIIGPFSFSPNNSPIELEFAIVWARDTFDRSIPALMSSIDSVKYYYQNKIHPCGGTFLSIQSEQEMESEIRLKIFPNPTDKIVKAEFSVPVSGTIEVYNLSGQKLHYQNVFHQSLLNIDVSTLSEGLYIIQFKSEQQCYSKKFIKY